ncbi:hypothetical protein [Winogradskya humida]|uniref:Uncharacterized protein n=1 Tax=Winogradskya humida TaxID=113566 RepID=A0ABQ4A1V2_9ACTN|nr:hypothetical protein [Actinoplanes humidus]GIE24807.1 hypothetical protein Ahu01nite_079090 [Actinoplanes humidus]
MTELFVAIAGFVTAVAVNEFSDLSPWLAERVIRGAARLWAYHDPELAEVYREEWAALVHERPGKVTKLLSAMPFLVVAVINFPRLTLRTLRSKPRSQQQVPRKTTLSAVERQREELVRRYLDQCRPFVRHLPFTACAILLSRTQGLGPEELQDAGALIGWLAILVSFSSLSRLTRELRRDLLGRPGPPTSRAVPMLTRIIVERLLALLARIRQRLGRFFRAFQLRVALALQSRLGGAVLSDMWL